MKASAALVASLIERGRNAPSFEVLEPMGKSLALPVRDLFTFGKRKSNLRSTRRPTAESASHHVPI